MFGARVPSTHPVDVGLRSETEVLNALVRRGHHVLVPYGFNRRYDFVIDIDGEFVRVQVKTGRLRGGVIEWRAQSVRCNMREVHVRSYEHEVDVFMVYCPETGRVYVVPAAELEGTRITLRVDPPTNGQSKRIRWAADYELPG